MRDFLKLVGRFARNEDGAFLILFGVMAIVLVALSGAVVDYVMLEQARNRAQVALDAAALSLQPKIYEKTDAELKTLIRALVDQQIDDDRIGAVIESVDTDDEEGSLLVQARLTVPTTFVALLGFENFTPAVVSKATRKKLFLEVAMVLDNSGSMDDESRMVNLKKAAKSATDILYEYKNPADGGDGSVSDSTYISVVPFNFWVNIGSSNRNAAWMDTGGLSEASQDNFDNDDNSSNTFNGPAPRFSYYDGINNVSWAGCVEARKQPYDADDTVPNAATPDTLFIPAFQPDEPDTGGSYYNNYISDDPQSCQPYGTCTWKRVYYNCNSSGNNCNSSNNYYSGTSEDGRTNTDNSACSCSGETTTTVSDNTYRYYGEYRRERIRTCFTRISFVSKLSDRERQERICKYNNVSANTSGSNRFGPNAACVSTPLLPLTNTRASVISTIDSMVSNGATNIHQGAIWGFHALSPTAPLEEGRNYETATYKVMILMTDGQNTYYSNNSDSSRLNGAYYYAPYGFPVNRRMGDESKSDGEMEDLVDARLLKTCENMKAAGIDIFTIGLKPPESVKSMLTSCAKDATQAFFPTNASELTGVFEEIALQLADLRLAQ
ncbi:TadE/TadG family type IV pilus assembly protein [Mariluticola halotolerans]|uniref:TadE/TadG family type IV pilus assembly protein n=1 Tax=Mariluticola halotolerans TaxID=2909283 RepID=UPI0026E1759B|nr:TadE/TadG family type IV pilus assembly protein [Mariluticola halotolerans]UJQ95892.1 pilus assembly protein [Mariluticola halotolerans]